MVAGRSSALRGSRTVLRASVPMNLSPTVPCVGYGISAQCVQVCHTFSSRKPSWVPLPDGRSVPVPVQWLHLNAHSFTSLHWYGWHLTDVLDMETGSCTLYAQPPFVACNTGDIGCTTPRTSGALSIRKNFKWCCK